MLKGIAQMLAANKGLSINSIEENLPIFTSLGSLEPVNLEVRFISTGAFADERLPSLQEALVESVVRGAPLTSILEGSGTSPTLATIVPVGAVDRPTGAIVLQIDANSGFLSQLPLPDKGSILLLDTNGRVLASSNGQNQFAPLSGEDLQTIAQGGFLIKTLSPPFGQRIAFGSLPMMDRSLVLAVALPLDDLQELVATLATRSILSILCALVLGAIIYTLLIRSIMSPITELLRATEAVARGELDYRINHFGSDEFARLSGSFNHMLGQIEQLYRERLSHQNELALAEEELRHKNDIEQKNAQIAEANWELQATIRELSALFQCNQAMISTLDLNLLFDRILAVLKDVLSCDKLVLLLHEQNSEELTVRKNLGLDPDLLKDIAFRLDEGITGRAAQGKQPIYIEDLSEERTSLAYKGKLQVAGSLLSVPMVIRSRLVGVLNMHKSIIKGFSQSEQKLAQAIANQAAIAIENAQLYEQTRTMSFTDELTGLANRRHFQEILEREWLHAQRYKSSFSLIMIDIDHFKSYNDCHGHLSGDAALKKVADVLLANTRGVDLAARYGGEEFILLLSQTDCDGAMKAAEKIRFAIESTPFVGAQESQPGGRLTLSLGISTYPSHSTDQEELVELADKALYRAKKNGRNRSEASFSEQQRPLDFSA